MKLSEVSSSVFGIGPILTGENGSLRPTDPKAHTIEFIGDSITCGYGVDDENRDHHFSTATEDVTKAYAWKTAQLLEADCSIFAISGYGILSGYTANPDKRSASQLIPPLYEKLGFSYQKMAGTVQPQSVDWNFENFRPEAVVINLGTNDDSYCNTQAKKDQFIQAYVDFLKQVRKHNPEASIFCVLGTMGTGMLQSVQNAMKQYRSETGETNVYIIGLSPQSPSNGYAADWHPTAKSHDQAAAAVAEKIRSFMGW